MDAKALLPCTLWGLIPARRRGSKARCVSPILMARQTALVRISQLPGPRAVYDSDTRTRCQDPRDSDVCSGVTGRKSARSNGMFRSAPESRHDTDGSGCRLVADYVAEVAC